MRIKRGGALVVLGLLFHCPDPRRELLLHLEGGRWGQGLEDFCPHLELYTQFAANAERSWTTLQVT